MTRVLLLSTTTGYQTRSFGDAAGRLGIELVYGLDRCCSLEDPWGDRSLVVRFYDDPRSVESILSVAKDGPIAGVLALGDRPTVLAARAAVELNLPFHPPEAALASRNKLETRRVFAKAGLPVPPFVAAGIADDPDTLLPRVSFPCVVKPLALSGSRGVIRADDPEAYRRAWARVRHILNMPDVKTMKDPASRQLMVEGYINGSEYAVEGLMNHGDLQVLAVFDKPDPLDGPFFEETIYVTPSSLSGESLNRAVVAVSAAAKALGLRHGPIHAECRVNKTGVYVLEIAARPIGGLCARALRFDGPAGPVISFEELLLRHAIGEDVSPYRREASASGVMMVPIPRPGVYRGVDGIDVARSIPNVEDVIITAKADQHLVPLPEGASYLGFIFANAETPAEATQALRGAHSALRFEIDRELPIV